MQYHVVDSEQTMGRIAADIFADQIRKKPDSVLGLATGSTPLPLYVELVRRSNAGFIDFSRVRTVNLDEYVGLGPAHPQSYRRFMQRYLFDHINIDADSTALPNGLNPDLQAECKAYDDTICAWGGIDIQLLGIGHNGHIGFNEPSQFFTLKTHVVEISERTRIANARFFDGDPRKVPARAITMGIRSIMSARKIVLLVSGAGKAAILRRALFEHVTPNVPASVLQMHHDMTVIADREAAESIEKGRIQML